MEEKWEGREWQRGLIERKRRREGVRTIDEGSEGSTIWAK